MKNMELVDKNCVLSKLNCDLFGFEKEETTQITVKDALDVFTKLLNSQEIKQYQYTTWEPTDFEGYSGGKPVYTEWKCKMCGHTVTDNTNFCPNCGRPVLDE